MMIDESLLPPPGESVRCASHAREIDLDPGGTALWLDELIVVDVVSPWPKPVWAADGFTAVPELVQAAEAAGRRVRPLAALPLDDGIGRVVTHVRPAPGAPLVRTEHHVAPELVPGLLATLLIDGSDASPGTAVEIADPARELLLCTQGSHDVCCGSRGTQLVLQLAMSHPDLPVRRVSHTGGHRMAPTGVTLPDGRMWGMVDHAEMVAILERTATPSSLAHRCRGWSGAADGPAQVAERAVFAAVEDWSFDDETRTATFDGAGEVLVRADRGTWRVTVEPGRAVPTIACGEPGGVPAKPGREWVVTGLTAL